MEGINEMCDEINPEEICISSLLHYERLMSNKSIKANCGAVTCIKSCSWKQTEGHMQSVLHAL